MEELRAIAECVKEFQTLLAGTFAVGAAWIAYRGAMRGVEARHKEARRAAAAAFFAELTHCESALIAVRNRVAKWEPSGAEPPPLLPLDTGVYDSNPSAVGLLPGDEAFAVVYAYKLLEDAERERNAILNAWPVAGATREYLTGKADSVRMVVSASRDGIRQTAEIRPSMAETVQNRFADALRTPPK